jgi:hypothetical protein
MKSIQETFNQIQEAKKEQKEISRIYKDSLENNTAYQQIIEDLKTLKEKKKSIEEDAQAELGRQYVRLEELKQNIKSSKEMLSDIAITSLMDGKKIEVKDEYNNLYEPRYNVSFKKTSAKASFQEE